MSASYLCPQGQKQGDNGQQKKSRVTPHRDVEGWQQLLNTSGQDQLRCTAHQVQVHLSVQL